MAHSSDQLLMNITTIKDIGSTIENDAKVLALYLQGLSPQGRAENLTEKSVNWTHFDTLYSGKKGGNGNLGNNLPACLQQDFENYENKQKLELNDVLQRRQQIGTLLQSAASLTQFHDQMIQQKFNIYSGVSDYYPKRHYYRDNPDPTNIQTPQGFEYNPVPETSGGS